jgi:hypothetical protein
MTRKALEGSTAEPEKAYLPGNSSSNVALLYIYTVSKPGFNGPVPSSMSINADDKYPSWFSWHHVDFLGRPRIKVRKPVLNVECRHDRE